MTEPVNGARNRTLTCEAPDEESTRPAERESKAASAKLDAYVEGGMCGNGASERAGAMPLVSAPPKKSAQELASERTRAMDKPLEDDPVGNALVGLGAAGIANGPTAVVKSVAKQVAVAAAKLVVEKAVGGVESIPGNADPHTGKVPPPYVPSPARPAASEELVCRGPIKG